jgi:hypothetical protein
VSSTRVGTTGTNGVGVAGGAADVAAGAVVNVHEVGAMTFPTPSVAPQTLTVYAVPAANAAAGVNVTIRLAASYDADATTGDPPEGAIDIRTDDAFTASLNVAVGLTPTATSVDPDDGVRATTVGAVTSSTAVASKTTST